MIKCYTLFGIVRFIEKRTKKNTVSSIDILKELGEATKKSLRLNRNECYIWEFFLGYRIVSERSILTSMQTSKEDYINGVTDVDGVRADTRVHATQLQKIPAKEEIMVKAGISHGIRYHEVMKTSK